MTSQNVSRGTSSAASTSASAARSTGIAQRTYVLDTSVLLSDPRALFRFAEHAVVLPVVVVSELESKRNDPEIGYFARQALRHARRTPHRARAARLPDRGRRRRLAPGRTEPLQPVGAAVGPAARRQRLPHPGRRVEPGERRPRRRRRVEGPAAPGQGGVDRHGGRGVPRRTRGRLRLHGHHRPAGLGRADVRPVRARGDRLRAARRRPGEHRGRHPLRARIGPRPRARRRSRRPGARRPRGLRPPRTLGRAAARHRRPARPEIGIVSLGGSAGTGKSALALCAGLEAVLERQQHKKIMVFRPLYAVGGQELGLPAR